MNIFTIDLGSEFVKLSLFNVVVENKKIVNYQLAYNKIYKNPGSPQLLTLSISRVYNDLHGIIDKVIILPERLMVGTTLYTVENDLTKQKVLESTRKGHTSKDKKVTSYQSYYIQKYDLGDNYVDVIGNSLVVSEYNKILQIAKDLRMSNISVFNPHTVCNYIMTGQTCITCDIGSNQMSLTSYRNGLIKATKVVNIELDDINSLILSSDIPGLEVNKNNVYKIKHSEDLLTIKSQNETIQAKLDRISNEISSFLLEEELPESTNVVMFGGYSQMSKEVDFLEYGREVPLELPEKFINKSKIPSNLIPYLVNSIASVEAFYHKDNCDLLTDSDKLSIISNNLYTFSKKCNWILGVAVLAFGINAGGSYITQYTLNTNYQQYSQNNQGELDSVKTKYTDISKKCDELITKAKLPQNNYKLSKNIALLSAIKPSNLNIDHMDYSNGTANYCVATTDLEQCVVFANKMKEYFGTVSIQPPTLLQKGASPIYEVNIVCSGFKGGM